MTFDLPTSHGKRFKNLTGKRFGRLLVTALAGRIAPGKYIYTCLCDCGNTKIVRGANLTNDHTHSCGCLQKDIVVARSTGKRYGFIHGLSGYHAIIRRYKKGAQDRGLSWELTREDAVKLFQMPCYYCKAAPINAVPCDRSHKRLPTLYNGIDRVDNSIGYTSANVVPCCKHCNFAKRFMTVAEFKAWIIQVHANIANI